MHSGHPVDAYCCARRKKIVQSIVTIVRCAASVTDSLWLYESCSEHKLRCVAETSDNGQIDGDLWHVVFRCQCFRHHESRAARLDCLRCRRGHSPGPAADVHNASGTSPELFSTATATGVAAGPGVHRAGLRLHHSHYSAAGPVSLEWPRIALRPMDGLFGHAAVLPGGGDLPRRLQPRGDWGGAVPASQQPPGGPLLHLLRARPLDHRHLGALRGQGLHATLLSSKHLPGSQVARVSFDSAQFKMSAVQRLPNKRGFIQHFIGILFCTRVVELQ